MTGSAARRLLIAGSALIAPAMGLAQGGAVPVTRSEAVTAAVEHGARLAVARADTATARALLTAAREWPNPTLAAGYSKDLPNYHYALEIPVDLPMQRTARIGSARASRSAAQLRFVFERAAAALDADTSYTRALAARDKAQLSRRTAIDADSLRRIAAARRDAGDASDLEVELATVTAGLAANLAAADSLASLSALLDLQAVMGLRADQIAVAVTDSLNVAPTTPEPIVNQQASPLQVAAAEATVESARLSVLLQRRSRFGTPGIVAGFDTGDPDVPGLLPVFGLALPLPLFNWNRGAVRVAEAEQSRARAELTLAEVESRTETARARRELAIARSKLERDRTLVTSADRVAAMSLVAYREGAASLPSVLEAQRSAREVQAQYVEDLAAVWIASAKLRVLTLTASTQ